MLFSNLIESGGLGTHSQNFRQRSQFPASRSIQKSTSLLRPGESATLPLPIPFIPVLCHPLVDPVPQKPGDQHSRPEQCPGKSQQTPYPQNCTGSTVCTSLPDQVDGVNLPPCGQSLLFTEIRSGSCTLIGCKKEAAFPITTDQPIHESVAEVTHPVKNHQRSILSGLFHALYEYRHKV